MSKEIILNEWDVNSSVNRMDELLHEISPLQRMIISPGLDKAFEIVKREIPETIIHEYPTGTECGDWEVPESWEVVDAFMKDNNGKIKGIFIGIGDGLSCSDIS